MRPSLLKAALGTAIALVAVPVFAGEIILFDSTNFGGSRMVIHDTMPNLDHTDFNDKTRSIVVRSGTWEVCSDARFQGYCTRIQPGEYHVLGSELDKKISSVREVGAPSAYAPPPPAPPQYAPPSGERAPSYGERAPSYGEQAPGYGGSVGAVLYEGSGFRGRSFEISRPVVRNLDHTSFNDRAESLRVYSGYWIFCSDANFEGECRTFGPGEYPQLPGDLNRKISSGRKISDHYPYGGQPNWGGR